MRHFLSFPTTLGTLYQSVSFATPGFGGFAPERYWAGRWAKETSDSWRQVD
ncbi:MAG: hypothetical protein HY676_03390 [Chloroflexi bacterium]|nr:hypothetical protein [Chloroflexota bacterium]